MGVRRAQARLWRIWIWAQTYPNQFWIPAFAGMTGLAKCVRKLTRREAVP